MPSVRVFLSSAPRDKAYRDELVIHLKAMVREGLLDVWHDAEVGYAERDAQVAESLERADVVLLLLSSAFFASDECQQQTSRALERQRGGSAAVVPILARACSFAGHPVARLQALPRDGKPLPTDDAERDEPWAKITEEIRRTAQDIVARRQPAASGPDVALMPLSRGEPPVRVLFLAANPGLGAARRDRAARDDGASDSGAARRDLVAVDDDASDGGAPAAGGERPARRPLYGALDLEREARALERALRESGRASSFELKTAWAVRASELTSQLKEFRPHVVHFSGHGERDGIVLLGDDDQPQSVPVKALGRLFELLRGGEGTRVDVRLAVLNACWSAEQARELAPSVGCAVGMRRPVEDETAIAFSATFYRRIAEGETLRRAFEFAKNGLDLVRLSGSDIPQLFP
jgi:CHAT domain/TIR domain